MSDRVTVGNLRVAKGAAASSRMRRWHQVDRTFWSGVDKVVADLTPRTRELLARRDDLRPRSTSIHRAHVIEPLDAAAYKQFLITTSTTCSPA